MTDEYTTLINNSTWTLVPHPSNTNIVRSMWLFKHKLNADFGGYSTLARSSARCQDAFLHGQLLETVYMHQPPGFQDPKYPNHVSLLQKSLYGLKQVISSLHKEFLMTDLGPLNYFLGIHVTRTTSGMSLSQWKYAIEIIERAGMTTCHPCRTPVESGAKRTSHGPPVQDLTLYRSLAGALQFLTITRPDISYSVQQICLNMHDPREQHMHTLRRVIRYIQGTTDLGLQLYSSSTSTLVAYSDADCAGCPTTRRSTSGYCVFLGNNLLSWSSKRQLTPSRSSAEAEYRGVANAVAETCWIRNLLRELHCPLTTATLVYCDNISSGQVRVLHVPSRYQFAYIFNKGLPYALFDDFRFSLNVRSTTAPTMGEC
ncbi:uncharacterized mitochondrial protein AtMg00810-like [Rutidosis leptorrhynchoides]|uniref:uncharacterized mitochondrial protein AtMg00810-like n=1 Tax=Rutidosis leptorrhynchoides TaxID=125765 RepID=UPI003A99B59E